MKAACAALAGCLLAMPCAAAGIVLSPPVPATCISSPFGWRHAVGPRAPAGMHRGVDLPAAAGTAVRAAAPGQVVSVRRMGMGGLFIVVQHADGLRTLYAHLGSVAPAIATGHRRVTAGEAIGRIGRTGITYGTHLFFELFDGTRPIDPAPLLGLPLCGK